jgi:anti-anti-sigma factor
VEISKKQTVEGLEVGVAGRLDAYWADHLSKALEEAVRDGAHRIRLSMADVPYMSSVGIRVLLKFYKELGRLNGSFVVCNPSEAVKTVLELAGLEALLATEAAAAPAPAVAASRVVDRETAAFEVFDVEPAGSLRCRVIGEPELLAGCRFTARHGRTIRFPETTFGLGLGGFGVGFEDCSARFGEFLAVAGAAAYLPTDGTNVPDYVISSKALVPELHVLYALVCEGRFTHLARFEAKPSQTVKLVELTEACLAIAGADAVGVVMVTESAGLMGAALRRSPAAAPVEGAPFTYPQIREWLSFTPERAYPRSLAVVVGVAVRSDQPALRPLLRPLGNTAWPTGHFHAAAFSYRPLPKAQIELTPTVTTLFTVETLQGVLHLLNDDRATVGAGQSEFVRGACWAAPITDVVAER